MGNIPLSGMTEEQRLRALLAEAQQAIAQQDARITALERDRSITLEALTQAHHQIGLRDKRISTLSAELEQFRQLIEHREIAFTTLTQYGLGD